MTFIALRGMVFVKEYENFFKMLLHKLYTKPDNYRYLAGLTVIERGDNSASPRDRREI